MMTDPRKFIFNSDFPTDQIIYMTSLTMGVAAQSDAAQTIAHGLGFTPLCLGNWSLSQNMLNSKGLAEEIWDEASGWLENVVTCTSDSQNIYIHCQNWTATARTFYIEIFAFAPKDANVDVPPTANSSIKFIVNTDYNYPKIVSQDYVSLGSGASGTVNHNLGYVPQIIVWHRLIGGDLPASAQGFGVLNVADYSPPSFGFNMTHIEIDENALKLFADSDIYQHQFYYRIYGDEL